jgi:hypothetical protein
MGTTVTKLRWWQVTDIDGNAVAGQKIVVEPTRTYVEETEDEHGLTDRNEKSETLPAVTLTSG